MFDDVNVIYLHGIVAGSSSSPQMIVTEHMKYGPLLQFIRVRITTVVKLLSHRWGIGLDWIVQFFTSPPTQYRLYGRRFLRVKKPNQRYQSTEREKCYKRERKQRKQLNTDMGDPVAKSETRLYVCQTHATSFSQYDTIGEINVDSKAEYTA